MYNEYCTILDLNYLPRGLVLYRSLAEVCDRLRLRVFCFDDATRQLLDAMELPGVRTIPLGDVEAGDSGLLATKRSRSMHEYSWTAKPAICLYSLESEPELTMITYLDSDLMFYSDPALLFGEFDGASIMIVPHRSVPSVSREHLDGTYNGAFLTFRRDENGLAALRWWRKRCVEWCYDRSDGKRFADQKYLDEFGRLFDRVHVLKNEAGGVAPWNSARYSFEWRDGQLLVNGDPLIFYHYQSFQLVRGMPLRLGFRPPYVRRLEDSFPLGWSVGPWWDIEARELTLHWDHYARRVAAELIRLRNLDPHFEAGVVSFGPAQYGRFAYELLKQVVPSRMRAALTASRGVCR
jgi:hypothetical protein